MKCNICGKDVKTSIGVVNDDDCTEVIDAYGNVIAVFYGKANFCLMCYEKHTVKVMQDATYTA